MLLKKVTMQGFKSFADKTEVFLSHGVTAVVGPNGCGKSNVVDAVRWVLGEQRIKVLRGGNKQDVIFNGCDSRKASGLCEVTLTFDNSDGKLPIDFNEVSVTRRLFRSGDSQYLINKTNCRLKDILELFMDTGVGTSSYSIIEQGQMDRIINARPSDRREIFEEASGITKYKAKRKEAQRKLFYAEENLTRLRDVISELERQKNSVSRQADKAIRYKKLRQKLELVDSQYCLKRSQEIEETVIQDTELISQSEESITKIKNDLENKEQSYKSELTEWESLDSEVKAFRESKIALEGEINKYEQVNSFKSDQIKSIEARLVDETQGREHQQQKLAELKEVHEKWLEKLEVHREQQQSHLQKVQLIQKDAEGDLDQMQILKTYIEDSKIALEDINLRASVAQTKLVENQTLEQNLSELIEKHEEEIDTLKLSISFEDEQLERYEDDVRGLKENKDGVLANLKNKEFSIKENQNKLSEIEASMLKVSSSLSEKSSRKEVLENLKQSYEGFFAGVRAIMLKKKNEPNEYSGVVGVVSDIIKTQSDYEVAVEVALGSRIQNVIVRSGEDAKKAISFLKEHRIGRVTFLPLDLMKGRSDTHSFQKDSRILGNILDFMEFDAEYRQVMQSLLGNYVVVPTLSDGISLLKSGFKGYNLVTLQGEMLSGSGAITGGDLKSAVKGFISRENEIEELAAEVTKLQNRIIEMNSNRAQLKESIDQEKGLLEEYQSKLHQASVDLNEAERELQKAQFQRDTYQKRLDILFSEMEKVSDRMSNLSASSVNIKENLSSNTDEEDKLKEAIGLKEKELSSLQDKMTSGREDQATLKAELSALNDNVASAQQRVNELLAEIEERQNWLDNFKADQLDQRSKLDILKSEIGLDLDLVQDLLKKKTDLEEKIIEKEKMIFGLRDQIDSFEGFRKGLQTTHDETLEKVSALKVRVAKNQGRLENIREHLFTKYQLELENIEPKTDQIELSWDEIPDEINKLDQKIKNLGNVNLAAIEELEKVEKRFEFLSVQEKDLANAEKQLKEVIEKINFKATSMFEETFNKIKVYFADMFVELFGGGKAELTLLEDEDILNAGIDIVARPPGKKPQTISLLSGGEKALTAVALLFALFKVKPSPFCILDELDAPLDDANINRFTTVLKNFSKSTQFIVITHNKSTLKIADLLYGVTQEVRGISKVISMKFVDEDLEHLLEEVEEKGPVRIKKIQIKEDEEIGEYKIPAIRPVQLEEITPDQESQTESASELGNSRIKENDNNLPNRLEQSTNEESISVLGLVEGESDRAKDYQVETANVDDAKPELDHEEITNS